MIPYGRQDILDKDISAVIEVLHSDWLTQGPVVPRFEQAVATKVGAEYAVAVNSATSALHIACLALGLGSNDWLWTSPNSFVASANCGLYCGAQVDFVDIDPLTYNMSTTALALKLQEAAKKGVLPKIVIPVHFAGQSCDMDTIALLSKQYGFKVIEDASHAIGGGYRDNPIGCCEYSDITVFSFHPVKIITTGEGGMALTNDAKLASRLQALRSHGITRDPTLMVGDVQGPWYYEQLDLGFNYRMTDIQAALGLSQLDRLEAFVLKRRLLAAHYDKVLIDLPLILPHQKVGTASAYHLYVVQLDASQTSLSRGAVFERLREAHIGVNVHYIPIHLQPYYQRLGFHTGQFPEAERYYAQAMSLPLFSGLSDEQQKNVIDTLYNILELSVCS